MTEEEWLNCVDPSLMLAFVRAKGDRRLRLFAAACCRRKWKYFTDDRCRRAVEAAETFADGGGTLGDLDGASQGARTAFREWRSKQGVRGLRTRAASAALALVRPRPHLERVAADTSGLPVNSARARAVEAECQCRILRDIVGSPFRPATAEPGWLTSTVVALAHQMYESRDFSPMPILGDALADADCSDEGVLAHCRGPEPHVRGCWVVDLVTGRHEP